MLALVQHGPTGQEQETTSFSFIPSKVSYQLSFDFTANLDLRKVELVSPELKKRGMEMEEEEGEKEKEGDSEQKRRRGKREKV